MSKKIQKQLNAQIQKFKDRKGDLAPGIYARVNGGGWFHIPPTGEDLTWVSRFITHLRQMEYIIVTGDGVHSGYKNL
jgi:hypothetical protein